MIIYCSGPIRGNTDYQNYTKEIIKIVSSLGHTALSELNDEFRSAIPLSDAQIFTRDIKWIERSDIIIAEVSGSSVGVGFEISYALYKLQKPVLAVANKESNEISAMVAGCDSELLIVKKYSDAGDLKKIVEKFIAKNGKKSD